MSRDKLRLKKPLTPARQDALNAIKAARQAPAEAAQAKRWNGPPPWGRDPAPADDTVAWAWMTATYPVVFNSLRPRPLHVGTLQQLMKARPDTVKAGTIRALMFRWCRRREYLKSLLGNTHRYHLDGSPAEAISAEHRAFSVERLSRKKPIRKKRGKSSQ